MRETNLDRKPILFLTSSAPRFSGDATAPFILNMAHDLCALGWRVDILAPHAPGLKKVEVIDGVTIRRFQYLWPSTLQTLCYKGGAAVNLKRNRFNNLAIPMLATAQLWNAFAYLLRERPALIHSHWIIPQGVLGQVLTIAGVPHVISVHGTDIYGFRGTLMRTAKRWALQHCDHVIANSAATRLEIEALCVPRNLSTIPTGATQFSVTRDHTLDRAAFADKDTKIILFVGRLIAAKGVRYLIEALPAIRAIRPIKALIVGDGPERSALQKLTRDLKVQDDTVFVGQVPHANVYDYFSIADVFVGPSIHIPGESSEAQGNTFVEALFARVPVVATRVGGITDAIVHERTGLLVDERSSEQIVQGVLRLFSETSLALTMREAGYDHASRNFSRLASAERIDAVYRATLEKLSG